MKLINQRIAPIVASSIAFILAIIKVIAGFLSWSVALLSSAIDSLMDMAVSIVNYFAIKLALKPADEDHQYWHGKIEWIAATIEWTVVFLSGAFVTYEAIRKIISPEPITYLKASIIVMVISITLTVILVAYLTKVYKQSHNLVIKGDIVHYKTDLITNIWVLITLVIVYFTNFTLIDWIVGLLLGIYIMKEAVELIKDWIDILMDKALPETEQIKKILEKFKKLWKINSYHCLKTRILWSNKKHVEFHMVVDPQTTVEKAHEIWDEIEEEIKKLDPKSMWYVIWHADPHDDSYQNHCV